MKFKFVIDTPEEIKETRKRIRELEQETRKLIDNERCFLARWLEKNVLLPNYDYHREFSFEVLATNTYEKTVLEISLGSQQNNETKKTKIAKLIKAGLNINTVLSSGIFTKEQKKELLDEILEEEK